MNYWLLVAGIIAGLSCLIHGIAGELTNIRRLREGSIPPNEQAELRGVWHVTTALLAVSAGGLFILATGGVPEYQEALAAGIAVLYILSGMVMALSVVLTRAASLTRVPGYVLLLVIGALSGLGALTV
ncbi:MAG: hypothetical protein JNM70_08445 [Anaerolineae bacterium]|nr:hypothetical protein [Anaerolineae bacterium]